MAMVTYATCAMEPIQKCIGFFKDEGIPVILLLYDFGMSVQVHDGYFFKLVAICLVIETFTTAFTLKLLCLLAA